VPPPQSPDGHDGRVLSTGEGHSASDELTGVAAVASGLLGCRLRGRISSLNLRE
jgi:hypothetical protein